MFSLVLSPTAHRQLVAASVWWEANRPAAPRLLTDEVTQAFARLAENPNLGTTWRTFRRMALHRSEYLIIYRTRPRAQRVEVVAFWHARRNPPR